MDDLRQRKSTVDRVHGELRDLAISYEIRPGERLNEVELANRFKVSRTPLREALNRMVAEGLLVFTPNRGFSSRPLDVKSVIDLYELRRAIETEAVRLACERVSRESIESLRYFWADVRRTWTEHAPLSLAEFDESFHERLAEASGNAELVVTLRSVNARLRFLRLIDMEQGGGHKTGIDEHENILDSLQARDAGACVAQVAMHISRRADEIVELIKQSLARLYISA